MRVVRGFFVAKLTFKEMCIVLEEQTGWREVSDFFAWMKRQLSYRLVPRLYGPSGKIKLAEKTCLEILEVGCEPDAVACGKMLCTYARWEVIMPC
ncbi:unnamed protein product [Arabis nemorensis]|uniref:Transposase n=1 Tax=Arabis nemorensis TaxID=586526 RepID=A0A565CIE9_9BRAS|nr:unnamed protein product [Arabis nemorensis]